MNGVATNTVRAGLVSIMIIALSAMCLVRPPKAGAAQLAQAVVNGVTNGGTSVSATLGSTPSSNDLLIAICGDSSSVTLTGPSGFSSAINEKGTISQAIFYKIATGTESTTFSCTASASSRLGLQVYEYKGTITTSPLDAVNTTASTGTSTSPSSGTVTTTNANDLLIAASTLVASTSTTAWSNSFNLETDFINTGGSKSSQVDYSGADRYVTSTGSYSSTATNSTSGAWRGQIAAFKIVPPVLTVDMVDGSGNSVSSPSANMSVLPRSFSCQTSTGTLGSSTQKIRVTNTTTNAAWTLSIAATGGSTAKWTAGTPAYDFNDPTGSGCSDGADADTLAGQLTVNPSVATVTPSSGCTNTGLTQGVSTGFNEGVTDAITVASASTSAPLGCTWDITGINLSQTVPATQAAGSYTLNLTLTIVAN